MKTLIILNEIEKIRYSIVDGDMSRFNGVIFNSMMNHDYEEECGNYLFNDESGDYNISLSNDISLIENKQWDKVAMITFLP